MRHGVASLQRGLIGVGAAAAAILLVLAAAHGADPVPGAGGAVVGPAPAWPQSPFHGVIDGATGRAIPCRCRYRDAAYRLGDTVCMSTHLGTQLARCDLFLNNTSWVPTGVPCTLSRLGRRIASR